LQTSLAVILYLLPTQAEAPAKNCNIALAGQACGYLSPFTFTFRLLLSL
jgi:hypothetical protein